MLRQIMHRDEASYICSTNAECSISRIGFTLSLLPRLSKLLNLPELNRVFVKQSSFQIALINFPMRRKIQRILGELISLASGTAGRLYFNDKRPRNEVQPQKQTGTVSSSGLARPHLNWNSAIKTMIADDEQKTEAILSNISKRGFQTREGGVLLNSPTQLIEEFSTLLITQ